MQFHFLQKSDYYDSHREQGGYHQVVQEALEQEPEEDLCHLRQAGQGRRRVRGNDAMQRVRLHCLERLPMPGARPGNRLPVDVSELQEFLQSEPGSLEPEKVQGGSTERRP